MSLVLGDGTVIVGPGNSPYIGDNGNWWIGHKDLGVAAGSNIHYITEDEFRTSMDPGVYFVRSTTGEVTQYTIESDGGKYPVMEKSVMVPTTGTNGNWWIGNTDLGIPVTGDGSTLAGAAIKDNSINGTTTYSSYKIESIIRQLEQDISDTCGKSVEFNWEGTRLGLRIEGQTEYVYKELLGRQGMAGLDGYSIVDAELTDDGDLLVTMQDATQTATPTNVVTLEEDGVLTVAQLSEIYASIARLNKEVINMKHGQYRKYSKLSNNTEGEYVNILTLNGSGTIQFTISKFTGTVKLSVDGNTYTAVMPALEDQHEYSLISLKPDSSGLYVDSMFADNFTRSLDVSFSRGISLELKVTDNDENVYPKILMQGTHYAIVIGTDDDDYDDYIPSEPGSSDDVLSIMGLI